MLSHSPLSSPTKHLYPIPSVPSLHFIFLREWLKSVAAEKRLSPNMESKRLRDLNIDRLLLLDFFQALARFLGKKFNLLSVISNNVFWSLVSQKARWYQTVSRHWNYTIIFSGRLLIWEVHYVELTLSLKTRYLQQAISFRGSNIQKMLKCLKSILNG